jgi:hypothetical protein
VTIRETNIHGLDGLNAEWVCPFSIDDYIVGFKNNGGITNSLFAEKCFELPDDTGKITINGDFNLLAKVSKLEKLSYIVNKLLIVICVLDS